MTTLLLLYIYGTAFFLAWHFPGLSCCLIILILLFYNLIFSFMFVNSVDNYFTFFSTIFLLTSINNLSFATLFDSTQIAVINRLLVLD